MTTRPNIGLQRTSACGLAAEAGSLALGLLIVNRQWPWVLEQRTNYEVYIGVDVLHNTAAITFFYEGGRRCFVRTRQSKQKERLLRGQIKSIIYECLKEDLADCPRPPRSIVIHRDGRTFECEWRGLQDAVAQLIREGLLPEDVVIGVVEIHKHSTTGLRLVEEGREGPCNPPVGSWFAVDDAEGIVCTTGWPFKFQGTVNPLSVRIARGNLDLRLVRDECGFLEECEPFAARSQEGVSRAARGGRPARAGRGGAGEDLLGSSPVRADRTLRPGRSGWSAARVSGRRVPEG